MLYGSKKMSSILGNKEFDHVDNKIDDDDDIDVIVSKLPKAKCRLRSGVSKYQGFWCLPNLIPNVINFQRNFRADDGDIVLASKPKSGTTWLKALLFSVVNRRLYTPSDTPLLSSNPHHLVPFFELMLYSGPTNALPDLSGIASPRLFSTHIPYASLPESIRSSKCRVVYLCRNPLDTLVSFWHFSVGQDDPRDNPTWTMEDCVDGFCRGESAFGPFWDHVLGFWRMSLERPEKVLFLKYEDVKDDTEVVVKRLAEFVGVPFSDDEERGGVVQQICELCSFNRLKDVQAEKKPENCVPGIKNETYFRKGEVGDWVNKLSPHAAERIKKVIQEKLEGSGLVFKTL